MKQMAILLALMLLATTAQAVETPTQPATPAPPATRRPAPLPPGKGKMRPPETPDYIQHNNEGVGLLSAGKAAEAAKEFEKALTLRKDYTMARFNLGLACLELKQPTAAAARFEEVLKAKPGMVAALDGLATAFAQQGRYGEAIETERKLLKTTPGHGPAYYNIACWQAVQNKTAEAFASLEEAVKLGYRDKAWMERDPELASLRKDEARWKRIVAAASRPVTEGLKVKVVETPKAPPAPAAKAKAPAGSK